MINRVDHVVAWSQLLQGLDDAREHLEQLVKDMSRIGDYTEKELRIDLGHVYAHLNRVWNTRNTPTELTEEQWEAGREFPKDIEPIA